MVVDLLREDACEQLEACVGAAFNVMGPDASSWLELKLIRVERRPARKLGDQSRSFVRVREHPFQAEFLGPLQPILRDGSVELRDAEGRLWPLFLSAYAADREGVWYEAIVG